MTPREELLHVYTEDGILLEGVHYPAESDLALVYTHGVTSAVFRRTHVLIGRELRARGHRVIAGNNRGTGLATALLQRSGPRLLGGSWFERLEDAAKDIAAWIDAAVAAGGRRVVLVGHSLGAVKVLLYASGVSDGRLAGLVLASAPIRGFARPQDPELMARARRALDEGRAEELIALPAAGLTFGRLSAATAASRARTGDLASRLRSVSIPLLALYGSEEREIGGQDELDQMAQAAAGAFTGAIVPGADHVYAGRETEAAGVIADWLTSVVLPAREREPAPR